MASNDDQNNFYDLVILLMDQLVTQGPILGGFTVMKIFMISTRIKPIVKIIFILMMENLLMREDMQLLLSVMDYLIINFIGSFKTLGMLIGVMMAFLKWKSDNYQEFLFLSLI